MNESDSPIKNVSAALSQELPSVRKISLGQWVRLVVSVALTGLLPICWLYLFAYRMGIPLKNSASYFLMGLGAVAVLISILTWGLVETRARRRIVTLSALFVFIGAFTGITFIYVAASLPFWQVWGFLLSGAAWTFWLAWFVPLSRVRVWGVALLVVLLGWGWLSMLLIKFDGLTGDAQAKFTWIWSRAQPEVAAEQKDSQVRSESLVIPEPDPLDFPEFLGNRQGHLASRPMLTDWEKSPPKMLWKKPIGLGWSSFALLGDLGITQEQRGALECTVCYRLSDGEELWNHSEQARFHGALGGDGPRTTPTIDEGRVYVVGGTGLLSCLDLGTGKKQWGVDLLKDNGGEAIYHGFCGSPLIVGRSVLVSPTGKSGISLAAYDKLTGRRYWRTGKWPATYSSPQLAKLNGLEQILVHNNKGIEAHDLEKGELLWSYEWTNNESTICSQPIVVPGSENRILLSIGYGTGSVLLKVDGAPGEKWSAKPIWTSKEMKTKFTTAVIHEGFIYGLDDGILACVDLETGKRRWKRGRYQHGQLLLVGEWLLIQAEAGDLVLVRANPEKLEEVGRIPALTGKTWNNPALGRDHLVVRNDHEVMCFRIVPDNDVKVSVVP